MDQTLDVCRQWSERGLFAMRQMLPLMRPVAVFEGWTDDQRETLGMLLTAAARSSESVMLLTAYGQLWDAEMVLRSVFEGTLKFVYLLESRNDFAARHEEYADSLFELALLKDHQKAKDFLDTAADPNSDAWRPIRDRVLADGEYQVLRARYDSVRRRELEGRWGFTTLLNGLSRRRGASFGELSSLAWAYSLASHLQHTDYVGVALPFDRDGRTQARREAIHRAHHARLVIDTLTSLVNRLAVGYSYVGADMRPVGEALAIVHGIRSSFGGAYEEWLDVEYGLRTAKPSPEAEQPVSG